MLQAQHETLGSNLDAFFSLFEVDNEIEVRDIADSDGVQQPLEIQQFVEIEKLNPVIQNDQVNQQDQVIQDDQVQQEDQVKQDHQVKQKDQVQKLNHQQNTASKGPRIVRWTLEEDIFLLNYIPRYGKRWAKAARKLNEKLHDGEEIRSGSHCRERWRNHLDPNLNSNS
jgi:hypothetical protein